MPSSLLLDKLILAVVLRVFSLRWQYARERNLHGAVRKLYFYRPRNLPGAAASELQQRERPELRNRRNGAEREHRRATEESARGSAWPGTRTEQTPVNRDHRRLRPFFHRQDSRGQIRPCDWPGELLGNAIRPRS